MASSSVGITFPKQPINSNVKRWAAKENQLAHFGVLSYKGLGHLNPLLALSRQLAIRGHRVTLFLNAELENRVRAHGLGFVPIGKIDRSLTGSSPANRTHKPSGKIPVLRYRISRTVNEMGLYLRDAPAALRRAQLDALIVDELALAGPTLAEMLRLPYFVISTSVPHTFGWSAPRGIAPRQSLFDRVQNMLLDVSAFKMRGPIRRSLDRLRRDAGLQPFRRMRTLYPPLAHITQLPQCLDFPRSRLSPTFHYTGPFVDASTRAQVDFPWNQLDGRPLIYASLGTTLKFEPAAFRLIAEACDGLGVQLVISLGGHRSPNDFRDMPGAPLVVKDAPQLELLKKAEVVITHAGANTVFETLMEGKPMIALPRVFDQPAIAARLARLGVAIVLPADRLSPGKIRSAVLALLIDPSYRTAAEQLQATIRSARGLEQATLLIEGALRATSQVLTPASRSFLHESINQRT